MMKQSTSFAQVATNLLNVLQGYTKGIRFVAVLTFLLTLSVETMLGADGDVLYTLSFSKLTSGSNINNYGTAHTTTVSNKTWSVTGNQNIGDFLGVGGKNTSNTDRVMYSTSQIGDKVVKKVIINNDGTGGSGTITLNSIKLEVASNSNFSTIVDTKTISSPTKSGQIEFIPNSPLTVWPENSYYRITYNYKNSSSSSNGYIKVNSVVFYEGPTTPSCTNPTISTQPTGATYTKDDSPTALSVVASGDDLTYQWYSNTSNSTSGATKINGATNSTYTPSTSTVGTKYYYCIVSSGSCSTTSNIVSVVVKNPPFTVTLNAGSGTCAESVTEPNAGEGVTLPTPTLSSACQSAGWSFAGWAEASVDLETTDEPTLIAAGGYEPTSNITLYAVYQRTGTTSGGGGGESHSITITPNIFTNKGSNNYGSGAERIGSENAVSFGGHYITGNVKNTPSSGATAGTYLQCQANNATIYNKTELPGKITKIVVNQHEARAFSLYCGKEQLVASNNTNTGVTPSGTKITDTSSATTMTWNVSGDYTFFAIKKGNNASYVTSIVITYQTDGGQSETTYYHSTPDCGTTETSRCVTPKCGDDSGGTWLVVIEW